MFRFSIRDVLWLTVVVGLGCAWWLNSRIEHQRQAELDAKNKVLLQANGRLAKSHAQMRKFLEKANSRIVTAEKSAGTYVEPPPDSN